MLHFDRHIIGEIGKFTVQCFDNGDSMTRAVKKIRVAKGNVLCPNCNLVANIGQHHCAPDHAKLTAIDRHNRAVAASMFAAACRFGITNCARLTIAQIQKGIALECRQISALGGLKTLPLQ